MISFDRFVPTICRRGGGIRKKIDCALYPSNHPSICMCVNHSLTVCLLLCLLCVFVFLFLNVFPFVLSFLCPFTFYNLFVRKSKSPFTLFLLDKNPSSYPPPPPLSLSWCILFCSIGYHFNITFISLLLPLYTSLNHFICPLISSCLYPTHLLLSVSFS